jgi:LmbE family N-acetylglucosaminyl deacetylase
VEPVPEDWSRAIAVVAHPDDLEYGAASAIARWTDQGKDVVYVLVTSGEAGIDGRPPAEVGPLREDEERASAAEVGVTVVDFLHHPDGQVVDGVDLRRDIAGAIRRHRPEVVLTMTFDLTPWGTSINHADHRAVGLATLDACRDAANRWLHPDLGEPWQEVGAAYVLGGAEPTHYVDVAATMDRGVASLRQHRAYLEGLGTDFDPDAFLRGNAAEAGRAVGSEAAVLLRRYTV